MTNQVVTVGKSTAPLPALFAPDAAAALRTFEFFTANIRNPHTRRAYISVAREFAAWCELQGVGLRYFNRR